MTLANESDDLDLVAFRYIAGEMTPEEAVAFETRLADDQTARVAVSRAVGLSQKLATAAPPIAEPAAPTQKAARKPARKSALVWAQPLAWMAIGATAAVLAVNLFSRPAKLPDSAPPTTNVQPTGGSSSVDALMFARLQSEQDGAAELERWLDQTAAVDEADESPLAAEVPSWVLAAQRPVRGVQP
jgi:anti-sigma-K factor RskA